MPAVAPMRVLVVDDNDDAAMTLAMLLKHCGHEAVVATGGEAALQQAPVFHPDAMFIDLAMPKIDGLNVARRLRQTPEFTETPLVAVSGYVDPNRRAQASAAGFTDFLAKPYALVALQETMERIARRVNVSRQRAEAARLAAEQTRRRNEQSRRELQEYWRTRPSLRSIPVAVQKSGISRILTLAERSAAEELRQWLKDQRCRVGPVFASEGERFSFFVYSRRLEVGELVANHGKYKVSLDRR